VLSQDGRDEAADRWYAGEFGPTAAIAQAVPYKCNSCGYWIRLNDSLGQAFGGCTNEMAPGEGRIVSYDYGCGAHSDVVIEAPDHPSTEHAFDTTGYDELTMGTLADVVPDEAEVDVVREEEADVVREETEEADAVQAEVEAAAEPESDDDYPMPTPEEIAAAASANY